MQWGSLIRFALMELPLNDRPAMDAFCAAAGVIFSGGYVTAHQIERAE